MNKRRFILTARHIRDDQDNVINESTDAAGIAADVIEHLLDDTECNYQFTVSSDYRDIGSAPMSLPQSDFADIRAAAQANDDKLDFERAARAAGWDHLDAQDEHEATFWHEKSERFEPYDDWQALCEAEGIDVGAEDGTDA